MVIEDVTVQVNSDRAFDPALTIIAGLPPKSLDDDSRPPTRNFAIPFTQRRTTAGTRELLVGGRTVRWYIREGEKLQVFLAADQDVLASVMVTVSGYFVYSE